MNYNEQAVSQIKKACEDNNITSYQLKKMTGMSSRLASKIVFGRHEAIPVQTYYQMCEILNIQPLKIEIQ